MKHFKILNFHPNSGQEHFFLRPQIPGDEKIVSHPALPLIPTHAVVQTSVQHVLQTNQEEAKASASNIKKVHFSLCPQKCLVPVSKTFH